MPNNVFANNREIACKSAAGKAVCAFPDVCFTPPTTPATPPGVPIPYPNTGLATDTTDGSRNTMISDKEIMLKNKSYFKTSYGDEAGCAPKKGMVTSVNRGKIYFNAWSMDVKIEGENAVRHLDLTTHNHASVPGDTPVWPYLDTVDVPETDDCFDDIQREKDACADYTPHGSADACAEATATKEQMEALGFTKQDQPTEQLSLDIAAHPCLAARRCALQRYTDSECCGRQTPHHLVEASSFFEAGDTSRGQYGANPVVGLTWQDLPPRTTKPDNMYHEGRAPCVCAEGFNQTTGTHGLLHSHQGNAASKLPSGPITFRDGSSTSCKKTTYGTAKQNGIRAMLLTFLEAECNPKCIEKQLDAYHNQCGINDNTEVRGIETGNTDEEDVSSALSDAVERNESAFDQR